MSDLTAFTCSHDTPFYFISQAFIENNINKIHDCLKNASMPTVVAYPYKVNSLRKICEFMNSHGLWAEVSSGSELRMANRIGINPRHIIYNGPFKSHSDLKAALSIGSRINIDNVEEYYRITDILNNGQLGVAKCGIRISTGISKHWDHFGFEIGQEAEDIIDVINSSSGIKLVGIHAHQSQIQSLSEYEAHLRRIFSFAKWLLWKKRIALEYIDVGSGFAIASPRPRDLCDWDPPEIHKYVDVLLNLWKKELHDDEILLVIEPGRYLVASAASLITKVVSIKTRCGKRIVIVDAGTNMIPGVDLYQYAIHQDTLSTAELHKEEYSIYGCLCDSRDIIAEDIDLWPLAVGDVLSVDCVGGYDMARSFSWQTAKPPILWLYPNGDYEIVQPDNVIYQ